MEIGPIGTRYERRLLGELTRTQLVQYAGASGDFNPLHTDEVYATKAAGYPSVFAHGMLTMAIAGRLATGIVGVGRLTRFGGRFVDQVWPGDAIDGVAEVTEPTHGADPGEVELAITLTANGRTVFRGYAVAKPNQ